MTNGSAKRNFLLICVRIKDRHKWPRCWWHSPPAGTLVKGKANASKKAQELREAHEKNSETIRRAMLALLGFSLFCLMTTFGSADVSLLAAQAAIQLPFADVPISFVGFLVAAPLLLIVLTIYLHNLRRLRTAA